MKERDPMGKTSLAKILSNQAWVPKASQTAREPSIEVEKSDSSLLLEEAASCIKRRLELDYTDDLNHYFRYSEAAQTDVRRATLVALMETHRLNSSCGISTSLAKIQRAGTRLQSLTPPGIADVVQQATSHLIAASMKDHETANNEAHEASKRELRAEDVTLDRHAVQFLCSGLREAVIKERDDTRVKEMRFRAVEPSSSASSSKQTKIGRVRAGDKELAIEPAVSRSQRHNDR